MKNMRILIQSFWSDLLVEKFIFVTFISKLGLWMRLDHIDFVFILTHICSVSIETHFYSILKSSLCTQHCQYHSQYTLYPMCYFLLLLFFIFLQPNFFLCFSNLFFVLTRFEVQRRVIYTQYQYKDVLIFVCNWLNEC